MHRKDAIAWVSIVCAVSLRLSQARTLSVLVASVMAVERISLAAIGRAVLSAASRHRQAAEGSGLPFASRRDAEGGDPLGA
jgi:hypothetical protein